MNNKTTTIPIHEMHRRAILLYAYTAHRDERHMPAMVIEHPHYDTAREQLLAEGLIERTTIGYRITQHGIANWYATICAYASHYVIRYPAALDVLHNYNPDGTRKES